MPPTPLNPNAFATEPNGPRFRPAYQICLSLEAVPVPTTRHSNSISTQVAARLLGHLLHELTRQGKEGAADIVVREITGAVGADGMKKLAKHYVLHLIKPFSRNPGRTPQPSEHPSRPSLEDERKFWEARAEGAEPDHRKAKTGALIRDGFRCVVSGAYDITSVEAGRVNPPRSSTYRTTEAAHIIPESLNFGIEEKPQKLHYTSGIWAVFDMFAVDLPSELQGANIHRLENILTLEVELHIGFDRLRFWMEPVPGSNGTYMASGIEPFYTSSTVTLTTTDPVNYPLPNPRYLALHAFACKIAHMSGAAGYLEEIYRETEETRVLAFDGSSAEILSAALSLVTPAH